MMLIEVHTSPRYLSAPPVRLRKTTLLPICSRLPFILPAVLGRANASSAPYVHKFGYRCEGQDSSVIDSPTDGDPVFEVIRVFPCHLSPNITRCDINGFFFENWWSRRVCVQSTLLISLGNCIVQPKYVANLTLVSEDFPFFSQTC